MALTAAHKKNTGQFDCLVTLQHYVSDESTGGGDGLGGGGTYTGGGEWIDTAEIWANIQTIKGYERLKLDAQDSTVDSIIELRYQDFEINAESRIIFKNRNYNLHYVINQDEQNFYFQIAASHEIL